MYAKHQVYLIIFCLIMPNSNLHFGIFHTYLMETFIAIYPGLQCLTQI